MEANNGNLPQDGSNKNAVSKDKEKREKGDLKELEEEKTGVSPARWWVLVILSFLAVSLCLLSWNTLTNPNNKVGARLILPSWHASVHALEYLGASK